MCGAERREEGAGEWVTCLWVSLCRELGISFKEVKHNLEGQGAEGEKDQQRGRNPQRTRCLVMPSGVKPVRVFLRFSNTGGSVFKGPLSDVIRVYMHGLTSCGSFVSLYYYIFFFSNPTQISKSVIHQCLFPQGSLMFLKAFGSWLPKPETVWPNQTAPSVM